MSASAGRVLILPKGNYAAGTEYKLLDMVFYEGASYIAKATTQGNPPTDSTKWQKMAEGGGQTIQQATLPAPTSSFSGVVYQYIGNTTVDYIHGYFYECIADPENPGAYIWQVVKVSEGGGAGISFDEDKGIIVDGSGGGGGSSYVLPPATGSSLGGVMIGQGIDVEPNGMISANVDTSAERAAEMAEDEISSSDNDFTDLDIDDIFGD